MQFRKFATLPVYQGQGIGKQLLQHTISEAQQLKAEILWCDARTSAMDFYQRFDFEVMGTEFMKSGVSYVKMQRSLRGEH